MRGKFSAYLSIFNDWDILLPALRSVAPFIDELVVVDGAYRWMVPYLEGIGKDPMTSDAPVYEALEAAAIPFRVVSNIWDSEIEKRKAGYLACSHRYIYRVDADEILFFNSTHLESFLAMGGAVAEMEMPLYVAPGWISGKNAESRIERQSFLFDSQQISADAHLSYLWLIKSVEPLPSTPLECPAVFSEPIAFNAHLSQWRTPTTSVNRAAFYTLNWIRLCGAPWFADLRGKPMPDLTELFRRVPPAHFLDSLRGNNEIVMGHKGGPDFVLRRSPLPATGEASFGYLYDNFLASHARANEDLAKFGRYMLGASSIDLSTPAAVQALSGNSGIAFKFASNISGSELAVRFVLPYEPWDVVHPIKADIRKDTLTFDPLQGSEQYPGFLRRILTMDITSEGGEPIQKFVCADLAGGTGPGPAGRSPASAPDTGAVEDAMSAGTELSETARRAADAATDAKDWVRAAELWDALRADLPHDPHRWFKAGEAYCEAGMLVDAERILSEAVVLFPDHLWIAHRHMVLPRRNSDWTEALQRAEKLREAAPHFWPAWVESADALAALGHVSQSEERRHQAVERFPDEFWPNYGVAKLTADRGDWAIAVRAWSELLIRFPSEAMASDGLRNSVEAAERKFAEAIDRTDQLEAEVESFRRALRMALTLEPE